MRKQKIAVFRLVIISLLFTFSCNTNEDSPDPVLYTVNTFIEDEEGWQGFFADYPAGLEDSLMLSFGHGTFSPSVDIRNIPAVIQTGYAANSDLFMFMKTRMAGFEPGEQYSVIFNVELYSQLQDAFPAGEFDETSGSFLKAGVFTDEPGIFTEEDETENLMMVKTDFDIGAAEAEGNDIINMGKLTYTEAGNNPTILYGYSDDSPILATADQEGKLWLMLGVDSNIPVHQSIYYSKITVSYQKVR